MRTGRSLALFVLAFVICAVVGTTASPDRALGAVTFVVNTTADEDAASTSCSLRKAIIAANTNFITLGCGGGRGAGVGDRIVFQLRDGTPRINISTPLPAITEAVIIDGGAGRVGRVELHGPGGPPGVSGAHGLTVGPGGAGTIIRNLVINNSADDGIQIDADDVSVLGCFIGTDATGLFAVPNQGYGIQVLGGNNVHIGGATSGGPCTGDCNVISGATNDKANVLLDLESAYALVRGNFIGTNVTGTAGITPHAPGVIDKGSVNLIGGTTDTTPGACTGDCNLISGNNGGIVIDQAANSSSVQGNFVGTDVTGNQSIGNSKSGFFSSILSLGLGAMIGGTTSAARNVVSGNGSTGIEVRGLETVVQGNYVGTNAAGTAAVPNSQGILVFKADSALIGGTVPGGGNLISGASGSGVVIAESKYISIFGNLIGTAADGITPLKNHFDGIEIDDKASQNLVGGQTSGAGNTIAFNGHDGVGVYNDASPVRGNTIRGNSIFANGADGIELVMGGNDNLAPPTIEGIGPLHGTSCAPCAVDIFSDSEDEGRIYEGTVLSSGGIWTFNGPLSGPHVTATSTDMSQNTSPFSAPFSLVSPTPTASPSLTVSATATATRTATRTVSSSATATQTDTRTASSTATWSATPPPSATATASRTATETVSPTATAVHTATSTASSSATPTPTPVLEATSTVPPTLAPKPTPTATVPPCTGDCDDNHVVSINELITGVGMALGNQPASACRAFQNSGGQVDIAQLVKAVGKALNGCGETA